MIDTRASIIGGLTHLWVTSVEALMGYRYMLMGYKHVSLIALTFETTTFEQMLLQTCEGGEAGRQGRQGMGSIQGPLFPSHKIVILAKVSLQAPPHQANNRIGLVDQSNIKSKIKTKLNQNQTTPGK